MRVTWADGELVLRKLVNVKVKNDGDKVVADDDGSDGAPVESRFPQKEADGLESQFDRKRRAIHGPKLDEVLPLYALDSCT